MCVDQHAREFLHGDGAGTSYYSYFAFMNLVSQGNGNQATGEEVTVSCPQNTFDMPTSTSYLPAVNYDGGVEQCRMVKADASNYAFGNNHKCDRKHSTHRRLCVRF